eukprot:9460227-Alexandrium_andersonii.AAC.1
MLAKSLSLDSSLRRCVVCAPPPPPPPLWSEPLALFSLSSWSTVSGWGPKPRRNRLVFSRKPSALASSPTPEAPLHPALSPSLSHLLRAVEPQPPSPSVQCSPLGPPVRGA